MRAVAYLCLFMSFFLSLSSIKAMVKFIETEGFIAAHSLGSLAFALIVLFNLYQACKATKKTIESKVFFGLNIFLFAASLILGLIAIFSLGLSSGISLLVISIYFLINVGLYLLIRSTHHEAKS